MDTRNARKLIASYLRSGPEKGQTIAMIAIIIPAFIGVMGLGVDVGDLYFNYYKLQTATDAAAIAGALCLPDQSICTASTTALSYANKNGVATSEINPNPPVVSNDPTYCPSPGFAPCKISISASRTVPYYFARLVGADSGTVNVTSIAAGGTVYSITQNVSGGGSPGNIIPIGLQYESPSYFADGGLIPLAHKCTASPCAAGNWDFLGLGGTGEPAVEYAMEYGYSGTLTIWDGTSSATARPDMYVTSEPGAGQPSFNSVANYRAATTAGACTTDPVGDTASLHSAKSPCAVVVPLVDWSTCGAGRCTMPILGFAEMWIDSVVGKGSKAQVQGYWIAQYVPGSTLGTGTSSSTSTSNYYGALSFKLIQ